jgi:hypothetical protein
MANDETTPNSTLASIEERGELEVACENQEGAQAAIFGAALACEEVFARGLDGKRTPRRAMREES